MGRAALGCQVQPGGEGTIAPRRAHFCSAPPARATRAHVHTQRRWVYFIFSLVKICVRAALLSKPAAAPRINMRSGDRKLQAETPFVSPIAA